MIENYQEINDILASGYYQAGKAVEDELAKFQFYFLAFKNLSVLYTKSNAGDRKTIQDYISCDAIMDLFFDCLDLNATYFDVFLEYPVFENIYHPNYSKEKCLQMKLPDNWGLIHNEEQKSIKNFQIIHSITMDGQEREFDEVMVSLFHTLYRVYQNVSHSYQGKIADFEARCVISGMEILEIVLPKLLDLRQKEGL